MKFLLFLPLLSFVLIPDLSFAAANTGNFVTCEGAGCDACHLVTLGENLLEWLIGVMLVIFALITAWAGFLLVTSGGNPQAKSDAKKKMMNAFIGIVIVLAAWLLVDTLMKMLLKGGNGELPNSWGPWSKIECGSQTAPTP